MSRIASMLANRFVLLGGSAAAQAIAAAQAFQQSAPNPINVEAK